MSAAFPTTVSDRERRLRKRSDFITDERDEALEALWSERDRTAELERRIDRLHEDNSALRRSREKWRDRAEAAEQIMLEIRTGKRKSA